MSVESSQEVEAPTFPLHSPRNVIFFEVSTLPINLFPSSGDSLTLCCSCYHYFPATEQNQRNVRRT